MTRPIKPGSRAGHAPSPPSTLPPATRLEHDSFGPIEVPADARWGAQTARSLRPGQIITKEYDTQRLNLEVDSTGRILAAKCG